MLSTASRPTPGQRKIDSVMNAPSSTAPTCRPTTVTKGMKAFFSACRMTTARCVSPFAPATRGYPCPSASARPERSVQPVLMAQVGDHGPVGLLVEQDDDRIAGREPEEREDDDAHEERHRDHQQQAPDDVCGHRFA